MTKQAKKQEGEMQGEGDRRSARRFNEKQESFARSEKGKKVIGNAAELEGQRKQEAEEAEEKARKAAKEKDPQVSRDYEKPEK